MLPGELGSDAEVDQLHHPRGAVHDHVLRLDVLVDDLAGVDLDEGPYDRGPDGQPPAQIDAPVDVEPIERLAPEVLGHDCEAVAVLEQVEVGDDRVAGDPLGQPTPALKGCERALRGVLLGQQLHHHGIPWLPPTVGGSSSPPSTSVRRTCLSRGPGNQGMVTPGGTAKAGPDVCRRLNRTGMPA